MKKRLILCISAFLLISVVIIGCLKNSHSVKIPGDNMITSEELKNSKDPQIQAELLFMKNERNVSVDKLELYSGSIYVHDGDGMIMRKELQEEMNKRNNVDTGDVSIQKHKRWNYLVSPGNKIVYCHNSVPLDWHAAMSAACAVYNSMGLSISLTKSTTGSSSVAGALVASMNSGLAAGTIAWTAYPNPSNQIGNLMYINPSWTTSLTADQKKYAMVHELGHAIGLSHTDGTEGISLNSWDYSCIPFACDGIDNASVFRGGVISNWSGFSYCDNQILHCLYGI